MTQLSNDEKRHGGQAASDRPPKPVLRFAPSPNGYLHLGHAYSALFTAKAAKALGGRLLLRIEDIDTTRMRDRFVEAIFEDLAWLGLEWDQPVRFQSAHMDAYRAALAKLKHKGLVYPARASRRQIAAIVLAEQRKGVVRPCDPDGAPLYPRQELAEQDAGPGPAASRLNSGRATAGAPKLEFVDIGPQVSPQVSLGIGAHAATPEIWGDAVLARKDIGTSYHLSVVVDDALQGITHVTRGVDLAPATHLHRLLQHHLGLPTPVYCHHGLLIDDVGQKLAKSAGSKSLRDLRAEGQTPGDIRLLCGIDRLAPYFEALAHRSMIGSPE